MRGGQYEIFELSLERRGNCIVASVVTSPEGQATVRDVRVPLSQEELRAIRRSWAVPGAAPPHEGEAGRRVEEIGRRLFRQVFRGEVGELLRASRREAGGRLRLLLRLKGDGLTQLPWELLYDSVASRHLGLDADTPIARYIEQRGATRPPSAPPWNILIVTSLAERRGQLAAREEIDGIEQALASLVRSGHATITTLDNPSRKELDQALRRRAATVFHFIGHGGFDEQSKEGYLELRGKDGAPTRLTPGSLNVIFDKVASLRLAVLNCCESGYSSGRAAMRGVAHCLVGKQVPAVVAMHYRVPDDMAVGFASCFYKALAEKHPVDVAAAIARRDIFLSSSGSSNSRSPAAGIEFPQLMWSAPVVYMRCKDGQVFDWPADDTPAVRPSAAEAGKDEQPSRAQGGNGFPALPIPHGSWIGVAAALVLIAVFSLVWIFQGGENRATDPGRDVASEPRGGGAGGSPDGFSVPPTLPSEPPRLRIPEGGGKEAGLSLPSPVPAQTPLRALTLFKGDIQGQPVHIVCMKALDLRLAQRLASSIADGYLAVYIDCLKAAQAGVALIYENGKQKYYQASPPRTGGKYAIKERIEQTSGPRVGAVCWDGWQSQATGSGACSHHKGVMVWRHASQDPDAVIATVCADWRLVSGSGDRCGGQAIYTRIRNTDLSY